MSSVGTYMHFLHLRFQMGCNMEIQLQVKTNIRNTLGLRTHAYYLVGTAVELLCHSFLVTNSDQNRMVAGP